MYYKYCVGVVLKDTRARTMNELQKYIMRALFWIAVCRAGRFSDKKKCENTIFKINKLIQYSTLHSIYSYTITVYILWQTADNLVCANFMNFSRSWCYRTARIVYALFCLYKHRSQRSNHLISGVVICTLLCLWWFQYKYRNGVSGVCENRKQIWRAEFVVCYAYRVLTRQCKFYSTAERIFHIHWEYDDPTTQTKASKPNEYAFILFQKFNLAPVQEHRAILTSCVLHLCSKVSKCTYILYGASVFK